MSSFSSALFSPPSGSISAIRPLRSSVSNPPSFQVLCRPITSRRPSPLCSNNPAPVGSPASNGAAGPVAA
eukprot:2981370-Pyramimonas_sp.AAC.1